MISRNLPRLLPPIVALAVTACATGEAENTPASPPAPEVTAAAVAVQNLQDWADFTGRIEAVEKVEIRARVSGYVEAVHFTEGGRVEQGDLLYQIDARPFQAEVDRLAAERARSEAELELARTYRDRADRLMAQNATSQEEVEQFAADAAVAQARLAAVQAALDAAELNLAFTRVTAPISGRVSRAIVTAGNLVDSTTLLTTLVADDRVYVYFDVDEHTYLEQVRRGSDSRPAAAYVGLINEEGYPHDARLDFVDNEVDADHGTIRARAVLDNPGGRFTPGLFARLKLVSPNQYRAALVDDRAIGTDLGHKFVFVVDDQNVVQYRAVETGRLVDGLRIVTSGLAQGDVVIVNGVQRVRPGITVAATKVDVEGGAPSLARSAVLESDPPAVHNLR